MKNAFIWSWIVVKWILFGLLSIPMSVFAKVVCWILPFFVEEETRRLPKWLDWFNTPNSPADGDPAHQQRHPGTGKWATYKRRTAWYWRNSAYGFDRQVVGYEVYASDLYKVVGNSKANRRPYVPGICLRKLYEASGKPKVWFFYFVLPWPFGLFKTKCVRGSLGWKLWCKEEAGYGVSMWTGMINPFFSRE